MRIGVPFFDTRTELAEEEFDPRRFQGEGVRQDAGGLRILHILRAPLGGLFRHVCDLAEEQTRMGHFVGIVCDSGTGGETARKQLEEMHPWCRLGIFRVRMSRTLTIGDFGALTKIHRHVARIAPDIVHGHGAKGGAYARLLPRARGRIALYTPHGGTLHYDWHSPAGVLFLGLERLLMARSDGILFESRFGERAYAAKVGNAACPIRVIPNGLGQADFSSLPENDRQYDAVFVGELRALKGLGVLIDAVASIARDRPFRLGIAGTGPDEWKFRAQIARHGLEEQVDFLGHRPARDMFAQAQMVVVPSLSESFPYIVLEAMASGRPLIATHVGGIPEMFGPHAEWLLPSGDAPALARAIRNALDAPVLAEARANQLLDRARKLFSAPRMARDITRFYSDLIPSNGGRAASPAGAVKLPETKAV